MFFRKLDGYFRYCALEHKSALKTNARNTTISNTLFVAQMRVELSDTDPLLYPSYKVTGEADNLQLMSAVRY